ncbi:MAG: peptidoglycan-binding protein [Solirubrobacteraceae bacterium]
MPRRRIAALAAILLVLVVGGAVVALQSRSPSRAAAESGIPPGDTTTSVQRRTLVEHTQVDGTLGYGGALELYDRLAGTFTWLPAVGAVIRRGGTLYKIDNLPIVLMYGSVPAYRTLELGIGDGPDVAELNANLAELGYDPYGAITAGDHFGEATRAAVRRWQKAAGLPQTGEVQLGRVLFASGARRITAVHAILGQDPPPSAKKPRPKKPRRRGARKKKAASTQAPTKAPAAKEATKKPSSSEGPSAAAPELALSTTGTTQNVQVQVKATEQQLARVGESVPVTLPDGDVVHGRITDVGTVASEASEGEKEKSPSGGGENPSGSGGENATIAVTVALDRRVARLDKAPVSVELVKSKRRNVLTVSATALIATAGGGYAIEVLAGGARRTQLAVTPGMFADGYVEIEGPGVHSGLQAMEPQ